VSEDSQVLVRATVPASPPAPLTGTD